MKLYTEEQVREVYLSGMYVTVSFEEMLQRLSPIELPSDDEISIISKQTAVEWLMARFESGDMYNVEDSQFIKQQAIKMEKEQLEEAWNDGNLLGRNGNVILEYTTGKEYYKETYKQ